MRSEVSVGIQFVWEYSGIRIYSGIYSGYSSPGSRIAGMEIQVFRNRKSSQTNANLHYSSYSYSGLIPNERALKDVSKCRSFFSYQSDRVFRVSLLPPQGFGPEAKTRGGIIVVRAYIEYIYIIYQTKSRLGQSGTASSIGRCDKMPASSIVRCDKISCTVISQ